MTPPSYTLLANPSAEAMVAAINSFPDGSISSFDFSGHSSNELLALSENNYIITNDGHLSMTGIDFSQLLGKKLSNNADITLFGCHTAQGENNIARDFSKNFPNTRVYGNNGLGFSFAAGFSLPSSYYARFTFTGGKTYVNGVSQ